MNTHTYTADQLALNACNLDLPAAGANTASLSHYKKRVSQDAFSTTCHLSNTEKVTSVTIQHYEHFLSLPYKYQQNGLMVRRHNVVSAPQAWVRTREGEVRDAPQYTLC